MTEAVSSNGSSGTKPFSGGDPPGPRPSARRHGRSISIAAGLTSASSKPKA